MKAFEAFTLICVVLLVELTNASSQGDFEYGGNYHQSLSFSHSSNETKKQEFQGQKLVKSSDQHSSSLNGQHSINQPDSSIDQSFSMQLNDYLSTDPDSQANSQASLIMTLRNSSTTPSFDNEEGTALMASSDDEKGAQAMLGHYQFNQPSSPEEPNLPNLPESVWFNSSPDASNYGQIVYVNQPPNSISNQPSIAIATVPLTAVPSSDTQTTVVGPPQRLPNGPDVGEPTFERADVYTHSVLSVPSPPFLLQTPTLPNTFPSSLPDPLTAPLPALSPILLPEPSPAPIPGSFDKPLPRPLPVTPHPLPHQLPRPLPYPRPRPHPHPLPYPLPCSNQQMPCKRQPSLPNQPTLPVQPYKPIHPIKPIQPIAPKPHRFGGLPDPNKYDIYYMDMENGKPKESKCKYYDIITKENDEAVSAVRGGFNMKILSILYGCDTAPVKC